MEKLNKSDCSSANFKGDEITMEGIAMTLQCLLLLGCVIKVNNLTLLFAIWSGCHATWSLSGCSQSASQ